MKFIKFIEKNDWEGEEWNFWLQSDGNEEELKQLQSWLGTFDEDGQEFELDMTPIDESEVDILVKHSGGGYMNDHNKVTGVFKCPEVKDPESDTAYEWMADNFYKGDIAKHFK